jgi:hypothetical protein
LGEIASKKISLQSSGVRLNWELEEELSKNFTGAASDYLSFFLEETPVGILNGFYTDKSPFWIKSHNGGYSIFEDDKHFNDITFLERPKFFDKTTLKGTRMERLCKMVAPGFPIIYLNRGCMYLGPDQCKFCVVGYIDTEAKKDPHEVAEVVRSGVSEDVIKSHVALTAGALPDDLAIKLLGEATEAIKDEVNIPVAVNAELPRDVNNIKWLANADSVYFNLEIFDGSKRREIMPGKSEFTIDHYSRIFSECQEYFGDNQVASVLLAGLEEDESYLQGIDFLAKMGVMPVPVPFYPTFHSKLEGTKPPSKERMKYLYNESGNLVNEYGLDPFKTKAGFMKGGAIFAFKEVLRGI